MTHSRLLIPIAALVALLQIGVLGSMIYGRASILRNGSEVTLKVLPVDPRDLLRGDYVSLTYNVSQLPGALFEPAGEADAGEHVVYVRLRPGADGIAEAVAARFGEPPRAVREPQDVDLRGTTYSTPANLPQHTSIGIDYGIERFYLPEGEGRPIEDGIREREFRMKVAVAEDGTGQIKAFYDGDTLIFAEPLY